MMNKNNTAVIWLSIGHFVNDIYTGLLNPIMPFIALKLGITLATTTLILSISSIFSSLMQPIFGFFADNMLKRLFIFWGLILTSIFIPFAPLSKNILILIILLIFGNIGSSFYHPQSSGFVNKFGTLNNTCSKDMGFYMSMGSLGYSLGPLLAAYVTQFWGMEKMPILSIIGLILAISMFLFVPKLTGNSEKIEYKHFKTTFIDILSNRKMNYLTIIAMMKSLISISFCTLLPFLWKDMNYTPFYIGVALFLFIISGGFGSLCSHKLESLVGSKIVLYFSMTATLPMILFFALIYKTHSILSLIIFIIIGFTTMLSNPITMILGQKIMPQYKSVVAGFMNGFAIGLVTISLSIIGFVAQKYGIINVLIILAILPIFAVTLIKHLDINYL